MRICVNAVVVGGLLPGLLACTKQNFDHGPSTICQSAKRSSLVVRGQVVAVGSATTAQQAGLPLGVSADSSWTTSGVVTPVTIAIAQTLLGKSPGSSLTFFVGGNAGYRSDSGSNFLFLAQDGTEWVAVDVFHSDSATGLLTDDNLYRGSQELSESDLLSQLSAAQEADPLCGACVAGANCPVLCKQGYEGCQLICDPADAGSCPAGQQCRPCPTGGSICYRLCDPSDAGSCPQGEHCAVSGNGGYVCAVSAAVDGG